MIGRPFTMSMNDDRTRRRANDLFHLAAPARSHRCHGCHVDLTHREAPKRSRARWPARRIVSLQLPPEPTSEWRQADPEVNERSAAWQESVGAITYRLEKISRIPCRRPGCPTAGTTEGRNDFRRIVAAILYGTVDADLIPGIDQSIGNVHADLQCAAAADTRAGDAVDRAARCGRATGPTAEVLVILGLRCCQMQRIE